MRHVFLLLAAVLILVALSLSATPAQLAVSALQPDAALNTPAPPTLQSLDERMNIVEDRNSGGVMIFVLILYATFCALWAQNTKRNPWLWFFLGLIFSIITAFIILHKNAMDLNTNGKPKAKPKS